MNTKNILRMFASLLVIFALLLTACAPAATEPPAAPEEPESPAEPGDTEEPTNPSEPTAETESPASGVEFPPPVTGEFQCNEGDNMVCIAGDNEDVRVIIPKQEAHGAFLYAENLPIGNLDELKSDNDEFKPYRLVINLELVLDPNIPEEYIIDFQPPIDLYVRYTEADVKSVGGLDKLQLGFWNEERGHWVSFANPSKYEYGIEGDETGGYFWVRIFNWGDRHIGFG